LIKHSLSKATQIQIAKTDVVKESQNINGILEIVITERQSALSSNMREQKSEATSGDCHSAER